MTEPVYRALKEQLLETENPQPVGYDRSVGPIRGHAIQRHFRGTSGSRFSSGPVSNIEFYQCRHTFATLLLQGGAEWRYIADQMGHSDLTMLQRHYWKWRPGSIAKPSTDPIAEALFI